MRVMLDTNILIDAFIDRGHYSIYAAGVFTLIANRFADAFIAPHSLSNFYYVLRNDIPDSRRRDIIKCICELATVVPVDNRIIDDALSETRITDIEDSLQYACAKAVDAECIVTRDTSCFKDMEIKALTAQEAFWYIE